MAVTAVFAWNKVNGWQVKKQDLPVFKVGCNEGLNRRLVYSKQQQDFGDVKNEVAVEMEHDSTAW